MIEYLRQQFAYDDWANREALLALEASSTPPEQAIRVLAHILAAERLWLERLQSQPQTYPVWPDFSLAKCHDEVNALRKLWADYLANLTEDDLTIIAHYKNTKGEPWTSRTDDVLQHVIIHSAHHRGQIVMLLRAVGHTPPLIDFIHAKRQGLIK